MLQGLACICLEKSYDNTGCLQSKIVLKAGPAEGSGQIAQGFNELSVGKLQGCKAEDCKTFVTSMLPIVPMGKIDFHYNQSELSFSIYGCFLL